MEDNFGMDVEAEDPVCYCFLTPNAKDLVLARQLQEEENRKREKATAVVCKLTGKAVPVERLYILDECNCKCVEF